MKPFPQPISAALGELEHAQQQLSLALLAEPVDKVAISAAADAVRQAERQALAAERDQR